MVGGGCPCPRAAARAAPTMDRDDNEVVGRGLQTPTGIWREGLKTLAYIGFVCSSSGEGDQTCRLFPQWLLESSLRVEAPACRQARRSFCRSCAFQCAGLSDGTMWSTHGRRGNMGSERREEAIA